MMTGFDPNWMPSDYGQTPKRPDYQVAYDPATMSIADYLAGKYDDPGFQKYREEALRKGPSQWANLARGQNKENVIDMRERGVREAHGQNAQAMDSLAARGGLSSGARERTAQEGAKSTLAMSQDVARQGNMNDLQIGINDEQNRIQQLSALPGMEMDQAKLFTGARQQDIANTLAENDRRNKYNQDIYGQQMTAWGANRQAQADRKSVV